MCSLLSDLDIFSRIQTCINELGDERALTGFGQNTIDTARLALVGLQMALVAKMQNVPRVCDVPLPPQVPR
jgi:hypothetical protein